MVAAAIPCRAQSADSDPKQRARAVRDLGKQGEDAIPKIAPYLADTDIERSRRSGQGAGRNRRAQDGRWAGASRRR